ncbi:uncharacterized protein [Typha angustifolia]|uniref:uncharacterized protein n=1 Tax=Typha angustifolia TaxID=59011 RepID=UPI003C2C5F7D
MPLRNDASHIRRESVKFPSLHPAMEADHASRGRRTLEEIRQKRAAERIHKVSSGSDLESSNQYSNYKSESRYGAPERDSNALLDRVKELEGKNAELERENQRLLSKLEEREVEKDSLVKLLNDLEHNAMPSLRKSLRDISLEKDAAVIAKEDALSQLRTIRKRLKEAEEEQYRAEEDAAALRAELNLVQQQMTGNSFGGNPFGSSNEHTLAMEKEILDLQSQLKEVAQFRRNEQHKLAEEQLRSSSLLAEKQELEDRLAALAKIASEEASNVAARKAFSVQDKEKLEKQLHDMALMVERLEGSRQKLLMEVDSQSSEIERLFEENSNLYTSYQDATAVAMQWESQVKNCLKQNEELRCQLDRLRSEQANLFNVRDSNLKVLGQKENGSMSDAPELAAEKVFLRDQLIKEQSRSEGLAAEVMKLSAELRRAVRSYNNLSHLYKPVLRNIENSLMTMKQETYATV